MNTQICATCNVDLPISHYEKNKKSFRKTCKSCRYKQTKQKRQERMKAATYNPLNLSKKQCSKCLKEKLIEHFSLDKVRKDGFDMNCRECNSKLRSKPILIPTQITQKVCNTCFQTKDLCHFKISSRSNDGRFHKCNSCWKPREWNKEKQKASEKKYVENNKEKLRAKWKRDGQKMTRKIKGRLCARIKSAFKFEGVRKVKKTYDYIGCSYDFLKEWFEFQFSDGMSWTNIGEWHIDHVKPCTLFDLTNNEDINKCFNWKNLRPCWALENLEKSDKIDTELIHKQEKKVIEFLQSTTKLI